MFLVVFFFLSPNVLQNHHSLSMFVVLLLSFQSRIENCSIQKKMVSSLNSIDWEEICKAKREGGLGIRDLGEVNKVYGLKLIWRLLSGVSLWGKWIRANLLKGKSFWEVKQTTQLGTWMWRKMLKLRKVAKNFYKKDLGNGRHTSFWFDHWSDKGVLIDLLGNRGIIDLGVEKRATVEEAVLCVKRRRRHRIRKPNELEVEISITARKLNLDSYDTSLWRGRKGFRPSFSTQETSDLVKEH